MGMYTEFFFRAGLQRNLPKEVLDILWLLIGVSEDFPPTIPDHAFFETHRWRKILTSSSYYFVPLSVSELVKDDITNQYSLVAYSSLKNYDSEIEKFVDWIRPYVDTPPGEMLGYSRYEESKEPEIFYY